MALQDQTLANTQAKMGLEVARRRRQRNADATLASVSPGGSRRPEELPWWAQGSPGAARGFPGSPGGLQAAPMAEGRGPGGLSPLGAALGAPTGPVPGMAGVKEGLSGLGGLILGVAGRKAAAKARESVDFPQTRESRSPISQIYEAMMTRGIMPDREGVSNPFNTQEVMPDRGLLNVLKVLQSEGLPGVERLVQQGLAPAVILRILGQQGGQDFPNGGWNGAPAGGGLPELGV